MTHDQTPAFATKWDFLFSTVLLGIDEQRQQFFARPGVDGGPLLCLWTDPDRARAELPEGYRLVSSPVRPRLAELPAGVGVVVDPDTPGALVVDADYAAELKRYVVPFPAGTRSEFKVWPVFPPEVRAAVVEAGRRYAFVEEVWALLYDIDDSPWIGLLVYRTDGGDEAQESIADALHAALGTTTTERLGVPLVHVVSADDLPPEVQELLPGQPSVYAR